MHTDFNILIQYLDIEMSKEEQMTLFDDLSQRVEEKISSVDQRLERIEFIDERGKEVYSASLILEFDKSYTPDEIGHFRALMEVMDLNQPEPHPTLWFAGRDAYGVFHSGERETKVFGHKMIVWSRNPDDEIQNTVIGAGPSAKGFSVFSGIYKKRTI
jgi:hypothetical protein